MTETPNFRAFLDSTKDTIGLRTLFPEGLPCKAYYATDGNNLIPKNFVFEVDYNFCSDFQIKKIFRELGTEHEHQQLDLEHHPFCITFDEVSAVEDKQNSILDLFILQKTWILCNHANKVDAIQVDLDGKTTHLIILGLQQALFINSEFDEQTNIRFLGIAIQLINCMSMGDSNLKEAYLTGFPCE